MKTTAAAERPKLEGGALRRRRCTGLLQLGAICALLLCDGFAHAASDPERLRRLLRLVHGIEQEYREAFDENGTLVRPIELEEASLLLVEAQDVARAIAGDVSDAPERMEGLAQSIADRAAVTVVTLDCRNLRETIVRTTGVADDLFPPAPPSADRGAPLYATHCASCHGSRGAGDGPDAARLKRPPPDFTDAEFMKAETPADFFLVISLGRRGGEMPAWEDVLSVQERWDLVSYLWFLDDDPGDQEERFASTLARVEEQVADAVSAYRLQEGGASALAMDAYLVFEPLEALIAARDPGAVTRVEAAFVEFHKALRLPAGAKEVEAAANAIATALAAVKSGGGTAAESRWRPLFAAGIGVLAVGAAWLVWRRR